MKAYRPMGWHPTRRAMSLATASLVWTCLLALPARGAESVPTGTWVSVIETVTNPFGERPSPAGRFLLEISADRTSGRFAYIDEAGLTKGTGTLRLVADGEGKLSFVAMEGQDTPQTGALSIIADTYLYWSVGFLVHTGKASPWQGTLLERSKTSYDTLVAAGGLAESKTLCERGRTNFLACLDARCGTDNLKVCAEREQIRSEEGCRVSRGQQALWRVRTDCSEMIRQIAESESR